MRRENPCVSERKTAMKLESNQENWCHAKKVRFLPENYEEPLKDLSRNEICSQKLQVLGRKQWKQYTKSVRR